MPIVEPTDHFRHSRLSDSDKTRLRRDVWTRHAGFRLVPTLISAVPRNYLRSTEEEVSKIPPKGLAEPPGRLQCLRELLAQLVERVQAVKSRRIAPLGCRNFLEVDAVVATSGGSPIPSRAGSHRVRGLKQPHRRVPNLLFGRARITCSARGALLAVILVPPRKATCEVSLQLTPSRANCL
jgi:hypothetical protein